jgi:hypothetical protein
MTRRFALPSLILFTVAVHALSGCDPATLAALAPLATGGIGLAEAAVRAEASKSSNPNAPEWKAAIAAAAKADRKHADALAAAEKKRDERDAAERRAEHAEEMAALARCGLVRDAGAEGGAQ